MANSGAIIAASIPEDGAAVFAAPLGTALPTDATTALAAAWVDLGYVSEDGVEYNVSKNTTKHYAWGGDQVKTTLDRVESTVKLALLETNLDVLKIVFGEDFVTGTDDAIKVEQSWLLGERMSFAIDFVDGERFGRLVVKEALVAEMDPIKLDQRALMSYGISLDLYKPSDGSAPVELLFGTAPAAGTLSVKSAPKVAAS